MTNMADTNTPLVTLNSYNLRTLPLSYSAKNTGCGFILLNHNEQMEIIIHRKPYQNTNKVEQKRAVIFPASLRFVNKKKLTVKNNRILFPEQFAIPRGRGEKNENILMTAVRELMEETGMHLEKLDIFNVFFELSFVDDQEYKYFIFMGYSQKTCARMHANKYLVLKYDEENNVFVVKETAKSVYMENRDMANALIQYKDYIRFMYESQLRTYIRSNYPELFNWMKILISEKKQGNVQHISQDQTNTAMLYSWNELLRSSSNNKPYQLISVSLKY